MDRCHSTDIYPDTTKCKSYLLGIHHCAHTDSQSLFRYFGQVIVEEPSIGDDRILR